MVLVSHVILQDHVINRSCDFMGKSPLRQVTLSRLVVMGPVVVEI